MAFYIIIFLIINYGIFIKVEGSLQILQETSYNLNNKYFKWLTKNFKEAFCHFDIISLLLTILCLFIKSKWYIGLLVLSTLFIIGDTEVIKYTKLLNDLKNKLSFTKRINTIIFLLLIMETIPFVIYLYHPEIKFAFIIIEVCILSFIYLIIPLINYIITPLVNLDFIINTNLVSHKLSKLSNLNIIGIAGSNGKSNTLNIINQLLKNDVITSKVNNRQFNYLFSTIFHMKKTTKYLAVELGATNVHEISKITSALKPKYGIITNIGKNHLDTFKSEENILKSTFELVDNLTHDGIAILNKDDILESNYATSKKVIWYGIKSHTADIYATNIKTTLDSTEFTLNIHKTNEHYIFKTKLLGYNNLYNLLSAIALLYALKIDMKTIQSRVKSLEQFDSYLSLTKKKNTYILNDQSSANPESVKDALNILKKFKGTKIVVTPGMINLGPEEDYFNTELGKLLHDIDYVILIGDKQTKCIQNGLKLIDYNMHNVYITNDSNEATKIIKDIKCNDKKIILLENNLSDIYSE